MKLEHEKVPAQEEVIDLHGYLFGDDQSPRKSRGF